MGTRRQEERRGAYVSERGGCLGCKPAAYGEKRGRALGAEVECRHFLILARFHLNPEREADPFASLKAHNYCTNRQRVSFLLMNSNNNKE